MTLARTLTDTFAGVRPVDGLAFIAAQIVGAVFPLTTFRWLTRGNIGTIPGQRTIAIISDIHGDLPALEAVRADLKIRPHDQTYCLGDLVGYGALSNEGVDRMRSERIPTSMGNYVDGVGFDRDDCGCAYRDEGEKARGQESLMWTRATTTAENKAFLRAFVPEIRFEGTANAFFWCTAVLAR